MLRRRNCSQKKARGKGIMQMVLKVKYVRGKERFRHELRISRPDYHF
jgi:hypothetical protein